MSIINCPECGEKISKKVRICPKCGYRMNDRKSNLFKIGLIINIISTVMLALIFFVLLIIANTDTSTGVDNTNGITITYKLDQNNTSTALILKTHIKRRLVHTLKMFQPSFNFLSI